MISGTHVLFFTIGLNDIPSNKQANDLFAEFLMSTLGPQDNPGKGMQAWLSLMDTVSIPNDLFKHETRLKWLTSVPSKTSFTPAISPDCTHEVVVDDNVMGKQWTVKDLEQHLLTLGRLVQKEKERDGGQRLNEMLSKVEQALGGPDASATVSWPLVLVMATRL